MKRSDHIHGLLSTYINLLKTVLGCGLLAFPVLVKQHGIIRVLFLTAASGLFSAAGLVLYAASNKKFLKTNSKNLFEKITMRDMKKHKKLKKLKNTSDINPMNLSMDRSSSCSGLSCNFKKEYNHCAPTSNMNEPSHTVSNRKDITNFSENRNHILKSHHDLHESYNTVNNKNSSSQHNDTQQSVRVDYQSIDCDIYEKPKNQGSLSELTRFICPRLAIVVDIIVCFKCFAVGSLFLSVIRSLLEFLCVFAGVSARPGILLAVAAASVAPMCFVRKLGALRIVSAAGLLCVVAMIFSAIFAVVNPNFKAIPQSNNNMNPVPGTKSIESKEKISANNERILKKQQSYPKSLAGINIWAMEDASVLSDFGQFVYAFTCHQNILACQAEHSLGVRSVVGVSVAVVLSAALAYLSYGLATAQALGSVLEKNTLQALQSSASKITAGTLAAYAVMLALSLPLQAAPCRQALLALIRVNGDKRCAFLSSTGMILAAMVVVAIYAPGFMVLASAIGGSFSALICYIFPATLYLKSGSISWKLGFMALTTLGFGLIVFLCFLCDLYIRIAANFDK